MKIIRIGVTGHRKLEAQSAMIESVREVVDRIAHSAGEGVKLTAISPLAEGADRIVAKEVLRREGGSLKVVLPLKEDDYIEDFLTEESKMEFRDLLSDAEESITLPPKDKRHKAYEAVGHYVVDNCDVLVALWDGEEQHKRGGTASAVAYARLIGRPMIWINTDSPKEVALERM